MSASARRPKRGPFDFFANPFVVLADVMVSLVFIIALFLLSTTVYSEQMELIAMRDARRAAIASSLIEQLSASGLVARQSPPENKSKYRIGNVLEVEDDGSLQRFRFLGTPLRFRPNSGQFVSPKDALRVMQAFGQVLLRNTPRIKSIVIEGHAAKTESNPWPLSVQRAENIRELLQRMGVLKDIRADFQSPIYQFLTRHTKDGEAVSYTDPREKIWDSTRYHEWHLEEYEAIRRKGLPLAWVITSGRGDQMQKEPVVEFKIEYTERDAPPLDDLLNQLPPALRDEARKQALMLPGTG